MATNPLKINRAAEQAKLDHNTLQRLRTWSLGCVPLDVDRYYAAFIALLFCGSIALFSLGIGEITGPTSKDEYHRVFRTALQMMEQDIWWIPTLDGVPRLEKPPLIPWLTRLSFEVFGVGLLSARIIIVSFTALFVMLIVLTSYEITKNTRTSIAAGMIALSAAPLAIHGRILLADIPTAAMSALGFYFFLRWLRTTAAPFLLVTVFCLTAGVLAKGPVAGVVFGSGLMACFITPTMRTAVIHAAVRNKWLVVFSIGLFFCLAAFWFFDAYSKFLTLGSAVLESEIEARRLGRFSLKPLLQLIPLSVPWTFFIPAASENQPTDNAEVKNLRFFFSAWLVFSVLPFLFIRSFDRYLIGSLVPMSLLVAQRIRSMNFDRYRLAARVGVVFGSLGIIPFLAFYFWFYGFGVELGIALLAYAVFLVTWWVGSRLIHMASAAAALWAITIGVVYPALGINEFPASLVDRVGGREVLFYKDVHPAMLAIAARRSFHLAKDTPELTQVCSRNPIVFASDEYTLRFEKSASDSAMSFRLIDNYKTLLSLPKLFEAGRQNSLDWRQAVERRNLQSAKSTIFLYELSC